MLLLGLEVPIFLILLLHDYSISRFLDQKALKIKQKDYEEHFLLRYGVGNNIPRKRDYIPLSFEEEHTHNLLNICTKYKNNKWLPQYHLNRRNVKKYKPKIEVQYVGFRRLSQNPRPVRMEMIRCTEDYALVAAENGWSGFVLEKDRSSDEKQKWGIPSETLFYILTKFRYGKKTPPKKPLKNGEGHIKGGKSRSFRRSRFWKMTGRMFRKSNSGTKKPQTTVTNSEN